MNKHEALKAMLNGFQVQAKNSNLVYHYNHHEQVFVGTNIKTKIQYYCNPNDINVFALFHITGKRLFSE